MGKKINEIGNIYGYLTVIAEGPRSKDNRATWICQCKCGNITTVTGKSLRNGHTKSCGCYSKECTIKSNMERGGGDLTGQVFGKLTVVEFDHWHTNKSGHRDRIWKCKCECGNFCYVNHRYLRYGDTQSCGCTKSRGNAKISNLLQSWNIKYQPEYRFDDLVSKYNNIPYAFDFAIFDNNDNLQYLIEYQGDIHFKVKPNGWNTEEALKDCQKRDKIKFDYCQNNNIKLYYITYLEDIETRLKEIINGEVEFNN